MGVAKLNIRDDISTKITYFIFIAILVFLFFPWGFISPMLIGGGTFVEYRMFSYILILISLITFLVVSSSFKTKKTGLSIPVILISIATAISIFNKANIALTSEFAVYLCCLVGLGFLANYLSFDSGKKIFIVKTVIVLISILSFYGLFQYFFIIPYLNSNDSSALLKAFENRVVSVLTSPAAFASVILLILPLNLFVYLIEERRDLRSIFLVMLALNFTALVLTKSKSGLVALILQLLLIMNFTKSRDRKIYNAAFLILLSFISLLSFYLLFFINQNTSLSSVIDNAYVSLSGRLSLWKTALKMFLDNPFLGFGANAFKSGIYKYQADGFYSTNAHSTFLQVFAEMGITGGIGIFALFFYLILKCCIANKNVGISKFIGFGIVGFFFMNIFDSSLYIQLPGYLFAILIGIAYAEVDVPIITHRDFPKNAFIIFFAILLVISVMVASAYFLYLSGKDLIAKDYKKSIRYLNLATMFNPVDAEYHSLLAEAYTAGSFTNKSFRYLRIVEMRRAVFLDPYNPIHYFELGYYYETEGQFQLAAYFYKKASETAPKQPYYLYQLGRLYLDNLRIEEAKKYLIRAVSLEKYFDKKYVFQSYRPGNIISESDPFLAMANASYLLGNISLSNQKPEVAVAHYTKAISLFPKLTLAYAGRASAYLRLKNYKQAEADAKRAIEMDPQNPDYFYLAALSSYNLKNFESALLFLDHCLELDPDYEPAKKLREEIKRREKSK